LRCEFTEVLTEQFVFLREPGFLFQVWGEIVLSSLAALVVVPCLDAIGDRLPVPVAQLNNKTGK
jgi:hypothetical protein